MHPDDRTTTTPRPAARGALATPLATPLVAVLVALSVLAGLPRGAAAQDTMAGEEPPAGTVAAAVEAVRPEVVVGVVMDGPWVGHEALRSLYELEMHELLDAEFEVRFPADKRRLAEWSLPSVDEDLTALLDDPEVDVVLALGVAASHQSLRRGPLPKPTLAPMMVSTSLFDVPRVGDGSGIPNLSYITSERPLVDRLRAFRDLADVGHVVALVNELFLELLPTIYPMAEEAAADSGVAVTIVPVGADGVALAGFPPEADGVLVTPMLDLGEGGMFDLAEALVEAGLPSFSGYERFPVEAGLLASLGSPTNDVRRARRCALNLQRILLGEAAETIPVDIVDLERLVINMATARALHVWPRFDLLVDAELINPDEVAPGPPLTLAQAVDESLHANLDLLAIDRLVAAGVADVDDARSALLPQVDALVGFQLIDKDRARNGLVARRTYDAAVRVQQLIYVEPVNADIDIRERQQNAREWLRRELELDVIQASATAYVDLLRIQTLLEIQRSNLELTRSNYELARTRLRIGVADRSEVSRWEAELADAKRAVVDTAAARRIARTSLNRLLNRPLQDELATVETGLDDPSLVSSDPRLRHALDNPWSFGLFTEFAVREARQISPEIGRASADLSVAERQLQSERASYWQPQVFFEGLARRRWHESGRTEIQGLNPDREDWTATLNLSYPLYLGGQRDARNARAREDVARLAVERASIMLGVEQRVRNALDLSSASYIGIRLSRQAAAAARDNLELVVDAYARGAVGILNLLDAQDASLQADLTAATAVFQFLIDFLEAERSVGQFALTLSPADRDAWFQRLVEVLPADAQGTLLRTTDP